MKKLNITKKQYDESKYFNQKYGSLKFVSESGKLYKTDKGVVLALESADDDEDEEKPESPIEDLGDAPADANGEEEVTVKKEDLATALQDVIDTVKDIAAENDVVLPEEEKDDEGEPEDEPADDEEEDDLEELEFDEGSKDEVCPKCGASMKKECNGPGCKPPVKKESCPGCKNESARRLRRAKLVREALARRARAKKIRESIERRARAKKVLESIRKRRLAKKILESARRRRLAKKVMEARKLRASRLRRVMESRRLRARRARLAK